MKVVSITANRVHAIGLRRLSQCLCISSRCRPRIRLNVLMSCLNERGASPRQSTEIERAARWCTALQIMHVRCSRLESDAALVGLLDIDLPLDRLEAARHVERCAIRFAE